MFSRLILIFFLYQGENLFLYAYPFMGISVRKGGNSKPEAEKLDKLEKEMGRREELDSESRSLEKPILHEATLCISARTITQNQRPLICETSGRFTK